MKYLAVIPARGGSKGLPGKNTRIIAGKPLIAWSIDQAYECGLIDCVHVSTDDQNIADVALIHRADVPYLRPSNLAEDSTATEPVITYALDWYERNGIIFDAIVLLQPTSPLRKLNTLRTAINNFEKFNVDSLVTVCENHHFFWRNPSKPEALYDYQNRPRRQDIRDEDRWYRENGSIYITRTSAFKKYKNRLCDSIHMQIIDEEEGWEIDSMADFVVIESLMKMVFNL